MSQDLPKTALPKTWPEQVRSAVAPVIALGRTAIVAARARVANSPLGVAYLRVKLEFLRAEISMLREELRIKDVRMAELEPREHTWKVQQPGVR